MNTLFSINFWFNTHPPKLTTPFFYILLAATIVFLAGVFIFYILSKQKGRHGYFILEIWRKILNFCITNTIIGLFWLFFNSESIPFFSSRFWYPIWAIIILVWIFYIYKSYKKIPEKKENAAKNENFKKYLP